MYRDSADALIGVFSPVIVITCATALKPIYLPNKPSLPVMVACPLCNKHVEQRLINEHIDDGCQSHVIEQQQNDAPGSTHKPHSFFTPAAKRAASSSTKNAITPTTPTSIPVPRLAERPKTPPAGTKRSFGETTDGQINGEPRSPSLPKRTRLSALQKAAPLAERLRPTSLDDVHGQQGLVGPNGLLRNLIEAGKIPSLILWGGPGTGKTTIARLIANASGARFVEINSTSTGVAEVKRLFAEALQELQGVSQRKTIIFCDEIHRFSKSQQDVFLGPVEAGQVTLIAATTENPSFKVINALTSRCRIITLSKLEDDDLVKILERALAVENCTSSLLDTDMLRYFASFADGDARVALNLLDLAMSLSTKPSITAADIKKELTRTLVYDRNGDQHYDTISALHKSIRGSNADAALYYLARMLKSGEDPLYIARRLVVVASEDVGLADNTLLPLAIATYTACEKIGMPECRINLAHAVVALCHAPKSTRSYRGLANAMAALDEPGIAGLPIPIHLRNAPTKMMKEMGYGAEYKYNPDYVEGRVHQEYLPERIRAVKFLEDADFGTKVDKDLTEGR
ncbi:P-loop containing nucleoside triphosphate hydrolase protein [Pleomassaria siparia CBS 279.74]|uniref:P-loop containing nucleoside triphosphate hydrolase protein n=1 Tax=Pleomassaria siparia CBS 279.74 TaxID=1314801 RepID=A0A6G1KH32_9PLEO|nr:P-loop containing nucleoside triphosphate hydrolase protein [Pleomassaria siparia CBS 279.74]